MNHRIEISTTVAAPVEAAWAAYTHEDDIRAWNRASDDWECTAATNDLREGGEFSYTMAAIDGSESFDFSGVYTTVVEHRLIEYTLDDDRTVRVSFEPQADATTLVELASDPEDRASEDEQRAGWQAILDNFAEHAERGSDA